VARPDRLTLSALTVGPDRLTLSALTVGDVPWDERVAAAARAGFAGVGLRAEDYAAAREAGWDDEAMRGVLDAHGVTLGEVELLDAWSPLAEDRTKEETVFHVARAFGVGQVNAGLFQTRPLDEVVEDFTALCRRAGELTVALEFMPFGGLPDLGTAWEVVRRSGASNAGLLVDAWHWARARTTPDALDSIPPAGIVRVQLSDVLERPMDHAREETLHHRLPPGEGWGDVRGFVAALRAHGVEAPVSVEVMSDELRARGPAVVAERMMAGARAVLAE
jgi:sugar phosphate isomerase/epimerase